MKAAEGCYSFTTRTCTFGDCYQSWKAPPVCRGWLSPYYRSIPSGRL